MSELSGVASGSGRLVNAAATVGRLLPYSVIPGGVGNAEELKNAIANDPVTARHYTDFDAAKAQVVRLDRNRSVYVSYRLGNRVYWTSHRLTMLKGETIITDGEHEARTRCGNRISNTPQQPVSMKEPEQVALENPPLPALPKDIPEWAFPIADLVPTLGSVDGPHEAVFVPPFIPPIVPLGGGSSSNKPTTPTTPVTPTGPLPPPVTATPEPASLLLLSSGILAVWMRRKHRR